MARLRSRGIVVLTAVMAATIVLVALPAASQEMKNYYNEEFGFAMRYPATWVKVDQPKGSYTAVFQDPGMPACKIHVAAIGGAKDRLEKYIEETRNGIKDLEKQSVPAEQQAVQMIDEGSFKCDVPGAYFFFLKALEDRPKMWINVVIVFYKQGETLVRVSCLAPESKMDQFHDLFNKVLVSVNFGATEAVPTRPTAVPPPPPGGPTAPSTLVQPPATTTPRPEVAPVAPRPPQPTGMIQPVQPSPPVMRQPETGVPATQVRPVQPAAPEEQAPAPRTPPRGPLRKPPATGIVE